MGLHQELMQPSVVLTPDGNVRAVWNHRERGEHLAIAFHGGGVVSYVIFAPGHMSTSGNATVDDVLQIADMRSQTMKPLPNPLYGCAYCAEEYSWPATELFWSERACSWVCDNCWDDADEHWLADKDPVERGITLAEELKHRGLILSAQENVYEIRPSHYGERDSK
jgi:hypothetical protein